MGTATQPQFRPAMTGMAKELVASFNWLQKESSPMAKAVSKLRKVYQVAESKERKEEFFNLMTFMIQLPLSSGSIKERLSKNDEKILETVCKFAVSFLHEEVRFVSSGKTKLAI